MSIKKLELKKIKKSDMSFLYELLKERDPQANISHKKMPTYEQHRRFVSSKPYKSWYVIYANGQKAGSAYLSKQNEIGIFLMKGFQRLGIGKKILQMLMEKNPEERYLANVSPKNHKSINFFKNNNFKLIQHTFEFIPSRRVK